MRSTSFFLMPSKLPSKLTGTFSQFLCEHKKTASDLRYWIPWNFNSYWKESDPLFTNDHVDALMHLVNVEKLPFPDAIGELNTLNPTQARGLKNLYALGLRNHHFQKRSNLDKRDYADNYFETLKELICDAKQPVTIEQAIAELSSSCYYSDQLKCFQQNYRYGLRKAHLEVDSYTRLEFIYEILSEMETLFQKNVLSIDQALIEMAYLNKEDRIIIRDHYSQGLRRDHLLFMRYHLFSNEMQQALLDFIKEVKEPLTSEQIISKMGALLQNEFTHSSKKMLSIRDNPQLFKNSELFQAEKKRAKEEKEARERSSGPVPYHQLSPEQRSAVDFFYSR